MRYADFTKIMTAVRMDRYCMACGNKPMMQYNQTYIFNQLHAINDLRNRIAHHEPICFVPGKPIKDSTYARQHYSLILQLFQWMDIDEASLLYGLDHIITLCNEIDTL